MAKVMWAETALSDLNEIAEYIALEDTVAAKALVQAVVITVERLEMLPESGRVPPELDQLEYREVMVSPYRVFYKAEDEKVVILFIMSEDRNVRNDILEYRLPTPNS